jgi:hypothetical protein
MGSFECLIEYGPSKDDIEREIERLKMLRRCGRKLNWAINALEWVMGWEPRASSDLIENPPAARFDYLKCGWCAGEGVAWWMGIPTVCDHCAGTGKD